MSVLAVLVVLGVLAGAHAQVIEMGGCRNYQTSNSFTKEFIQKMTSSEESFAVVLSTETPLGCQQLRFFENGTFLYSYATEEDSVHEVTGVFKAKTSSFSEASYIDLEMPAGVFGNGMLGNLRLYVLQSESDHIVLASCWPLALLRVENVHALVPNSRFTLQSGEDLSTKLTDLRVPHIERLREVPQLCNNTIPEVVQQQYEQENRTLMLIFGSNFTYPNLTAIVTRAQQISLCANITAIAVYDSCISLVMVSDAALFLLFGTPIPICRPIYNITFNIFCTYYSARHDLPFLDDSNDSSASSNPTFDFKLTPPTTSYLSYPGYLNNGGPNIMQAMQAMRSLGNIQAPAGNFPYNLKTDHSSFPSYVYKSRLV